jgi:hypothetical protein
MLASVLIIGVSTVLFLYWFRYTCELILSTRSATSYVAGVAEANSLNWSSVTPALDHAPAKALDSLRADIRSDYLKLDTMLARASATEADQLAFERGMLRGYFCCSCAMFSVTRTLSDRVARNMLHTMTRVVEHQANLVGERSRLAQISLS